jgi:hypothetical protein
MGPPLRGVGLIIVPRGVLDLGRRGHRLAAELIQRASGRDREDRPLDTDRGLG